MALSEFVVILSILAVVLIVVRREKIVSKYKKLVLFDKIFISSFIILWLLSLVIFFIFRFPFNLFALLPREILIFFNPIMALGFLGFAALKWYTPDYKKTTPKVKTKKFEDRTLVTLFKSHKVLGSGESTDPYIIENRNVFPEVDVIKIKKSKRFILFRNHDLKSIKIKKSSNIVIENCNYSFLQLLNCSEVKIIDCTFDLLEVNNSVKISVQNTAISHLKIFRSFLNEFENCSIKKIEKRHSPDNTFNIKEQLEDKGRKSNVFQNNIPSIMILFLASLITGDILFFSILINTANFYMFLIVPFILFFCFLSLFMLFKEAIDLQRKLKKYYDGKIALRFKNGKLIFGCALIILGLILINMFFFILYSNPMLWIQFETTTIYLLSIIIISSITITIGVNTMLRNISSFNERFVRLKNPIYPSFLLYNIFYANFLIFTNLAVFLFSLDNVYLIIAALIAVFILIDIIISIGIKFKQPKLKTLADTIKLVYGITLVALGTFTNPLVNYLLATHVYYYGLLNYPQEAFFYIAIIVLSLTLVLVGFQSFPKFSKLFSATQYSKKEKYAKSIKTFKSALKNEPNNETVLHNLGFTYFKNEEYTKSVETLKKALTINQNSIPTLIALGYASAEVGDFETAIGACEKAIRICKNPVVSVTTKFSDIISQIISQPVKEESAWQALSYVYSVKKEYDKVVETASKAINLNPKFKEAWVSLAYGYNKSGEINKAIEACNSALEIDSNFASAWNHLGLAYQLKGDLELGVQMLEKAAELSPKEHKISFNLAKIYVDSNNYKQAFETINTSLALKPNYQDAIDLRQQIYARLVKERIGDGEK